MSNEKIFKPEDFDKPKLPDPKPTKLSKIALGVLVVLLLVVGCYFLLNNDISQEKHPTALVSAGDSSSVQKDTAIVKPLDKEDCASHPKDEEAQMAQATPAGEQTAKSKATSEQKAVGETATGMTEDVDKKALKVIRGIYGNGQVRKDKLGSEYQTIQNKVNEMYRKGLVR